MGYYINPKSESKEDFLNREGTKVVTPRSLPADGRLAVVCLVDNGFFTAAGVCYSQRELEAFQEPMDTRTKVWYTVPKDKLYDVTDGLSPNTFR